MLNCGEINIAMSRDCDWPFIDQIECLNDVNAHVHCLTLHGQAWCMPKLRHEMEMCDCASVA